MAIIKLFPSAISDLYDKAVLKRLESCSGEAVGSGVTDPNCAAISACGYLRSLRCSNLTDLTILLMRSAANSLYFQ